MDQNTKKGETSQGDVKLSDFKPVSNDSDSEFKEDTENKDQANTQDAKSNTQKASSKTKKTKSDIEAEKAERVDRSKDKNPGQVAEESRKQEDANLTAEVDITPGTGSSMNEEKIVELIQGLTITEGISSEEELKKFIEEKLKDEPSRTPENQKIDLKPASNLEKLTFDEDDKMVKSDAGNQEESKLKQALKRTSKETGISEKALALAAAGLSEEDIARLKKSIASNVIDLIKDKGEGRLTIPHALAVHVINYPGVFFDTDSKKLTFEDKTVELVFDENVENFNLE